MKKLIALGFISMFMGSQAHASFMNVVTGADMAGIEVTASFEGGLSETLTWEVISAGNGLTDTVSLETAKGGVSSNLFSLTQQGDSQGNVDTMGTSDWSDDIFYGLWSLTNLSDKILTSLVINVMNTNVVFDSVFNDNGNGSEVGRGFEATAAVGSIEYGNNIQDELFGKLTVNVDLAANDSLNFFADTDIQNVPAPAALSLLLLGLGGLVVRRKKA